MDSIQMYAKKGRKLDIYAPTFLTPTSYRNRREGVRKK